MWVPLLNLQTGERSTWDRDEYGVIIRDNDSNLLTEIRNALKRGEKLYLVANMKKKKKKRGY